MNIKSNKNNIPEEAIQLLPWYATGWLSSEERDYVKEILSESPELQELLLAEHEMIRAVKEDKSLLEHTFLESTEIRLESVLKKIDLEPSNKIERKTSVDVASKLKELVSTFFSGNVTKTQYAAFAAISTLSIALLFAFISPLVKEKNIFHPATVETTMRKNTGDVTILLIGTNVPPNNPQLLKVLNEAHATIDVIPGRDGMYSVSLPERLNSQQANKLVEELLMHKDLFWFAGEAY